MSVNDNLCDKVKKNHFVVRYICNAGVGEYILYGLKCVFFSYIMLTLCSMSMEIYILLY